MVIQEMTRGEDRMTRQDRGLKEELGDQTDHFPGGWVVQTAVPVIYVDKTREVEREEEEEGRRRGGEEVRMEKSRRW